MRRIRKNWKISLIIFLLTIILSMTAFYLLYRFNNKYTTKEEKAIHGILYVDQEYIAENGLYHLSREWEYYPDVLLNPEDLNTHKEDYYCRYISIGEYGGMELDDEDTSPYGSGTYRMLLVLPEKEQSYSLYLPEIFSSYRLYIGGEMMHQMGNPEPTAYYDLIQNRVFTFKGSGTVEIMIGVTDYSSIASGMQYIPVLGTPFCVNLLRGVQVFISAMLFAIVLFVSAFSVYMFCKTKAAIIGLYFLISLCVLGYVAYPVLHSYLSLRVLPWYALESLFYFGMFPLMIWLQDEILELKGKRTVVFAAVMTVFSVLGFVGEWFLPRFQSSKLLYAASGMTEVLKWMMAAYLIGGAVYAMCRQQMKLLLICSVIYGCSLAADRIWPIYEPMVGGWFAEWGSTCLLVGFGAAVWGELSEAYRFRLTYEEHSRSMEQRILMQKQHYEEIEEKVDEVNKIRHDMRQHMRTLVSLLEHERYTDMKGYLREWSEEVVARTEPIYYCENMAVDAILHYYAEQFEKEKAEFKCRIAVPEHSGISDLDYCKIFGNLLENALEAIRKLSPEEHRYVHLNGKIKNQKLLLEIVNSCRHEHTDKIYPLYSTKHSGYGIGTSSIAKIAEKYGGYAVFEENEGVFKSDIFLPLAEEENGGMIV